MFDKPQDAYEVMNHLFGDTPVTFEERYYDLIARISTEIVKYRIRNGLSQEGLADKLDVSQAMVSKYESGDYNFTLKSLFMLLGELDITLDVKFVLDMHSEESVQEPKYTRYTEAKNEIVPQEEMAWAS